MSMPTASVSLAICLLLTSTSALAQSGLDFLPLWPINKVGPELSPALLAHWRSKSAMCPGEPGKYVPFPTTVENKCSDVASCARKAVSEPQQLAVGEEAKYCEDGDMVLFNGMLCAVGVKEGCAAVAQAQSHTGEWFRSSRRRVFFETLCTDPKNNNGPEALRFCLATFSPDMGLGSLLYVVKTKDHASYSRWLNWMEGKFYESKVCFPGKGEQCIAAPWPTVCSFGQMKDKNNPSFEVSQAHDCALRPWDLPDYRVVATSEKVALPPGILAATAKTDSWLPPNYLQLLSSFEVLKYPAHLDATRILLRILVTNPDLRQPQIADALLAPLKNFPSPNGVFELDPVQLNLTARVLAERDRDNPYYRLLAHGATPQVERLIRRRCPAEGESFERTVWLWEEEPGSANAARVNSGGWDCVFVGELYNKMRVAADIRDDLGRLAKGHIEVLRKLIGVLHDDLNELVSLRARENEARSNAEADLASLRKQLANAKKQVEDDIAEVNNVRDQVSKEKDSLAKNVEALDKSIKALNGFCKIRAETGPGLLLAQLRIRGTRIDVPRPPTPPLPKVSCQPPSDVKTSVEELKKEIELKKAKLKEADEQLSHASSRLTAIKESGKATLDAATEGVSRTQKLAEDAKARLDEQGKKLLERQFSLAQAESQYKALNGYAQVWSSAAE